VEDLADDIAGDAGLGAGTSAGPSKPAACEKKAKKPSPKAPAGALPTLPCLARVRPCLRGLSLDVSRLLTFSAISEQPESEELELVEALTPPAVHYLVSQLFDTVKLGLADASSMSVVRGSTSGAPTRAQDLSAMERRRLTPAALLARLKPALLTFRVHMKVLAELIPTTLRESDVVDAEAAFGGREDDQLNTRFVEPALLLLMQSLRAILESRQLSDECSQRELVDILAAFDNEHPADHVSLSQPPPCDAMHVESVGSQVRPSSGTDPAAACAAAFDFFDVLFSTMPSIALQSELIALARAILGVLMRHTPSDAEEVAARRARLSDLASSCLQRERADDRDFKTWQERAPATKLVRSLFEVQTSFCESPHTLLNLWTQEILPDLGEPTVGNEDAMLIERCPLFTKSSAPHFIATLFGVLSEEAKKLPLPPPDAWRKAAVAAQVMEEGEASTRLEAVHDLSKAFVQLVLSTRIVSSKTLNKQVIAHSARFINILNKRALPLMNAFFKGLNKQVMELLKSLQPATRLLQVHCTMVKERQQIAALGPAATLKRELEGLVFQVKVLLQGNDCREAFWMGNLKHKDVQGNETSSQFLLATKGPNKPRSRKRKLEEGDDGEEEEAPADAGDEEEDDENEGEEEEEEEEDNGRNLDGDGLSDDE